MEKKINKIFFIIFIILLIGCEKKSTNNISNNNINNQDNISQNDNDALFPVDNNDIKTDIEPIKHGILNTHYWSYGDGGELEIGLSFDLEKSQYKFTTWGPEWTPMVEGNFEIKNNVIHLTPTKINTDKENVWFGTIPSLIKENWELRHTDITDSMYFTKGLAGKGHVFANPDSSPQKDIIRNINGIEMITVEHKDCRLKENARIRNGPGIQYEIFIIDNLNYLPAGEVISIFGHSRNIETHNGLSGYWYYGQIMLPFDSVVKNPDGSDSREGWVFGPLLEELNR
jgi:hypothetical protein